MKGIVIRWRDSAMFHDGQYLASDVEAMGLAESIVVGILAHENEERYVIALEHFAVGNDYRMLTTIPKSCVVSAHIWELFSGETAEER